MKIKMNQQNKQNKILEEAFREYLVYCRVKNLSSKTLAYYEECYCEFIKFYPKTNKLSDIDESDIDNYIFWLRENTGFSDISINTRLRGLRAILYYFMKLGYIESFKITLIKADKKVYETYSEEELKLLLKKPNTKICNFTEYRDWTVCNTLIGTGIRVGTLIELRIEDIDFNNDLIKLTKMKGRKQQLIPMSNTLHKVLMEYIQYRNGNPSDYLFCSLYGVKLTLNAIGHNRRGVVKTGIHLYRHTYAKPYLGDGGNVFKLQKLLSHLSLDIVKEYVDLFTSDLQKDYDKLNPLEMFSNKKEKIHMRR